MGTQHESMLRFSPVQQQTESGNIEVLLFDGSNLLLTQPISDISAALNPLQIQVLPLNTVSNSDRSVYACALCAKFSQKEITILKHIETSHGESLLGVPAKVFITKLQALHGENETKAPKRKGRPKKCDTEKPKIIKLAPQSDPVLGPDGFYWCQNCCKHFRKSRQLLRHICIENDDQQEEDMSDVEEENIDTDTSKDFKLHLDIDNSNQPAMFPCKKRSINKNQVNISNTFKGENCRMPIFSDQSEKSAFEKHLKNIDFSCVDHLILKDGRRCHNKRNKSYRHDKMYAYTCQVCNKVFKALSHIRMHCLIHTSLKPFTCPKCSYTTNTKGNLYIHMRKHTGNVFRCNYCEFQSGNRSHIIEHEETHLPNNQLCDICEKMYKTTKSLINHVRTYHTNARGKKYLSSLTWNSKHSNIVPNNTGTANVPPENSIPRRNLNSIRNPKKDSSHVTHISVRPEIALTSESPTISNSLNNIEAAQSVNFLSYEKIEHQPEKNDNQLVLTESKTSSALTNAKPLLSSEFQLSESICEISSSYLTNYQQHPLIENSKLHDSESTIYSGFQFTNLSSVKDSIQEVSLTSCEAVSNQIPSDFCNQLHSDQVFSTSPLLNNSKKHFKITQALDTESQINEMHPEKHHEEIQSAESKLFEKCHRLQAYVCCVCTSIFVDPVKLKNHLKEHAAIDNDIEVPQEQHDPVNKPDEVASLIDNVCKDLTDSLTEEELLDKHLEKLYTSSLDMSWFLPELSVNVEYDPNLFDVVLEDSCNFPIIENAANDELNSKASEETILKYFEEMC